MNMTRWQYWYTAFKCSRSGHFIYGANITTSSTTWLVGFYWKPRVHDAMIEWYITRRVWKICNRRKNLRGNWCSIGRPSDGDLFSSDISYFIIYREHVIAGLLTLLLTGSHAWGHKWIMRDTYLVQAHDEGTIIFAEDLKLLEKKKK